MRGKIGLDSLRASFKNALNDKWQLAFLAFIVIYATFLALSLPLMPIQWDEVTHLNGGVFLLRGDYNAYFSFNAFYPPLYDIFSAGFFAVGGISVVTNRMVSVVFSLLTLYAVFEFARRAYGSKTALLAALFLGLMPGYIWLSRMAMIETMLIFFATVSTLFFFSWLRTNQNKFLILSGLTLGLGILTKYQLLVVGAIMITSMVLLGRGYLKKLARFPLLILTVVAVVTPWIVVSYQLYASGMLNTWLYALNIGNPDKLLYSFGLNSAGFSRFPDWFFQIPSFIQLPIFYLLELTVPYHDTHPISFFLYALGLAGLGFFAWRRKVEDKFLLLWFFVIYIFFTAIPNKQWRYVVMIFPVLAVSAASLLTSAFHTAQNLWRNRQLTFNQKRFTQLSAGFLIALTVLGVGFSVNDAYIWAAKDQVYIPIRDATEFAGTRLSANESIVVVCAQNLFSQDMVRFYLNAMGKNNTVFQYPELPVDTYTPVFNITEFIDLCKQRNVKYVFTYEFGGDVPYFNTTLSLMGVYTMLYASASFSKLSDNETVTYGVWPRRIFILTFLGEAQLQETRSPSSRLLPSVPLRPSTPR
ncbi:MAG: ArnT family glycosyltransferase [Candidatus Bathyarchaeia archaeon]